MFVRRVELIPDRGAGDNLVSPDSSRVKKAVRAFALEAGLECAEGSADLIIECRRQPVTVRAVRTRNSIAVCFGAMGVPFESRKFTAQMDRMQSQLTKEFGQESVRVLQEQCPAEVKP